MINVVSDEFLLVLVWLGPNMQGATSQDKILSILPQMCSHYETTSLLAVDDLPPANKFGQRIRAAACGLSWDWGQQPNSEIRDALYVIVYGKDIQCCKQESSNS
jgi:hypothetical protein